MMDSFFCSTTLDAGTHNTPNSPQRENTAERTRSNDNTNEARYVFPDPETNWDGPDRSCNPEVWFILGCFERCIPLPFQKQHTRHVPFASDDVTGFLAHEAINVYSEESPSKDACGMGALAFGRLHHLNIHAFEEELAKELVTLQTTRSTTKQQILRVRKLLAEYCQAITNFDMISTRSFRPPDGQSLYPYHETLLLSLCRLIRSPPDSLSRHDNIYHGISTSYATWSQTLFNRVWGALFGGVALILPMIIMTVPNTTVQKSLVVSSLSVFLVAAVVARFSKGSWKDVLGITAAYAAVLVVFVGTTTGPNVS